MFAYCGNNPQNLSDPGGSNPFGKLNLFDYWLIHKFVQAFVSLEYSLFTEVYVKGPLGRGYLDLYDYSNHSYYEVKSVGAASAPRTAFQILKYDTANKMGKPIFSQLTNITKLSKGKYTINGDFTYGNYRAHYGSVAPGLIVYEPIWKEAQSQQAYAYEPSYSFSPAPAQREREAAFSIDTIYVFATVYMVVALSAAIGGMLGRMDNMRESR